MTYINSDREVRAFKFVSVNWRDPMQMRLRYSKDRRKAMPWLVLRDVYCFRPRKIIWEKLNKWTHYGADSFIVHKVYLGAKR